VKLSAIILASGSSTRFGVEDKLTVPLHGKPLIRHVIDTVQSLGLCQTLLVTAPASSLASLIGDTVVTMVTNDRHREGMGTSIAAGVTALAPCDGVFILPGDMPFIDSAVFEELRYRFDRMPAPDILAPAFEGRRGHPVLFSARCFGELAGLEGDRGAAAMLASGHYYVELLAVSTPAILLDIDTPEDLVRANRYAVPQE